MTLVLINFFVFIGLLCIIEISLRALNVVPSTIVRPVYYTDLLGDYEPSIHVRNNFPPDYPHHFSTDSQGFRSTQELVKDKDAITILCLGDSFTMGWGLDDQSTYPEQLRSLFEKRYPGRIFNVVNAGRLFSNVLDQIDYYRAKGHLLKAKIVIFQYYFNDLADMVAPYVAAQAARKVARTQSGFLWGQKWWQQTAIYNCVAYLKYAFIYDKRIPSIDNHLIDSLASTDIHHLLVNNLSTDEETWLRNWDKVLDEQSIVPLQRFWDNQRRAIQMLKEEVEADGGTFVLLCIPNKDQMMKYKNAQAAAFNKLVTDIGLNMIDMTPVFRKFVRQPKDVYLEKDEHTNAQGNALIASEIMNRIKFAEQGAVSFVSDGMSHSFHSRQHISIYAGKNVMHAWPEFVSDFTFTKSDNLRFLFGDQRCGLTLIGPVPDQTSPATLTMSLKLPHKSKYIDIVTPVKLTHTSKTPSWIKLTMLEDGVSHELFFYESNKTNAIDSSETIRISECVLSKEADAIELVYNLCGEANIFTENTPDCDKERRIEIYAYPDQ